MYPRILITDKANRLQVVYIPAKNMAEYNNPEFYAGIKTFCPPGFDSTDEIIRMFEAPESKGNIARGDILICSYVSRYSDITSEGNYVVVTEAGYDLRTGFEIKPQNNIFEVWKPQKRITS
jgi:hypothetical protein